MRRAVGLAVAGCLLAAGCAGPSAVDAAARPPATSSTSASRPSELTATIADRLYRKIRVDPTYAGIAIHGRGVQVWAVGGGSARLRAAVAAVHEVPVRIMTARHSARELSVVIRQLSHDRAALSRRGIELSSWGPDLYANIVVVGLRHYSPARAAYLVQHYGADLLKVSPRSEVIVPL